MKRPFPLQEIQAALSREDVEGWLFFDFQGSDPIACRILRMPETHRTRRWFYLVPRWGAPRKLVHRIEKKALDHLPGERLLYAGWRELEENLSRLTAGFCRVAMNYSPENAIPYVSRVDAGTVELVRAKGVEVVTSADLVQQFEAVLTGAQLKTHVRAAEALRRIVDLTFAAVAKSVGKGKKLTEYDVSQFILKEFDKRKLVTDSPPIAAVGPHSGDPHYEPGPRKSSPVRKGDFLLIDLWAREKSEQAVYADITWTGFVGKEVPEKYSKIFRVVAKARDAALGLVEEAAASGRSLKGRDVDDAARGTIVKAGYGEYFVHRTGHNIGNNVHGNGANMDNFETREERKVLPGTCFSIEPGIYLPEFGVRSEIDVYLGEGEAKVFGRPIQTAVVPILA